MVNIIQIILQVILLEYCAFLNDSDVVLFQNLISTILTFKDYDLIAQKGTGFMQTLAITRQRIFSFHPAILTTPRYRFTVPTVLVDR